MAKGENKDNPETSALVKEAAELSQTPLLADRLRETTYVDDAPLEIDSVENQHIQILDIEEREGDYGMYAFIYFTGDSGKVEKIATGAEVVLKKLRHLKAHNGFPVMALVVKVHRYWDLV